MRRLCSMDRLTFASLLWFVSLSLYIGETHGYGIKESDLKCYNCSWTRALHEHLHTANTEPPVELMCNRQVCNVTDGMCIKEINKIGDKVMSVKRFCGMSNEKEGCFVKQLSDGAVEELCICSDWHYCNLATKPSAFSVLYWLLSFFVISWPFL
ncbi:uncharacterized protein LOC143234132 [Tachypleus tridentatus]|uniref:uncharacterized protein LOC143234132 n=1 Tax=Tachypleus tridentatus TaxID=6853 RepID=UPI003FD4C32D